MVRNQNMVVWGILMLACSAILLFGQEVLADQYSSPSYKIDASVMNSFGGSGSSANYQMVSSGGESIIGSGSSGSYKMNQGYVAQLEKSIQLTVQPYNLSGYWALDEPSGTLVYDSSAYANNGNTVSGPSWGAGKLGGALTLNGSTQYATLADIDIASAITVEAWVYPTATQTSKVISKFSTSADTQGNIVLTSSVPSFVINTGGVSRTAAGSVALSNNVWSHLTGVYDGTTAKLYVNGSEVASTPATGSIAANNFMWTLGRDANASSNYFTGSLDGVKLFSAALSSDQVLAEYTAQNSGLPSGLSIGTIIPGASSSVMYSAIVATDSSGYDLYIQQDQNLTKGSDTISPISGTIASPLSWTEGATKGLGFSLVATNATAIPGKWNSGDSYAAIPMTSTAMYNRTGVQTAVDKLDMRLRLDVTMAQPSGLYSNTVTFTGTITP